MILGIGNDIIEIDRIRGVWQRHPERFMARLLTPSEQVYCLQHSDPTIRMAGRFCAKEAIIKALGLGFGKHAAWLDIELLNNDAGKPYSRFSPRLQSKLVQTTVHVSISHCHQYAAAIAIWACAPTE